MQSRGTPLGNPPRTGRRGFSIVELTIAGVLLAVVMVTAVPALGWIVRQRQASERQQAAILGVGNLMERLTSLSWEELTPERAGNFALPESLQRQLPEARLEITVFSPPSEPHARRLSILLAWDESTAGTRSAPVRLTAWVYRRQQEVS